MAKKRTFEDILKADFRWPKKGDTPFRASEQAFENACLTQQPSQRLVFMIEGYKTGADLMVEKATEDRASRDFLVYPIIFNYRQFIELSLKYLISTYGAPVRVGPNWRSHNLATLWRSFTRLIDGYGTDDPDKADEVVAHVVAEFSKIDPGSYSYRYPVDRRGKAIPLDHEYLDLKELSEVMESVGNYFTGCDGYFDSLKSAGP